VNPFCPQCKVLMRLKFKTQTDKETGRQTAGKYWVCPKCNRRYKAGAEIIR